MKQFEPYFEYEQSIHYINSNIQSVMRTISERYMSLNCEHPITIRGHYSKGIKQNFNGFYLFDFNEIFPEAKEGEYVYAMAYAYSDRDYNALLHFRTKSPSWVYLNNELIFCTEPIDEALYKPKIRNTRFIKGRNLFVIKCRKNEIGFGCEFGDAIIRGNALNYVNPTKEHMGKRGWAFTVPCESDIYPENELPYYGESCGDIWLPSKNQEVNVPIGEVLPDNDGFAYAVTWLENSGTEAMYDFSGAVNEDCEVYIDGELKFAGNGDICFSQALCGGSHEIVVQIHHHKGENMDFSLKTSEEFSLSKIVRGTLGKWMYLGMLEKADTELCRKLDLTKIYKTAEETIFWKTDEKDTDIRLSVENGLFGTWTYPIGVVLYGLNEAANVINDEHLKEYTRKHMEVITSTYEYALWDTSKYGRAAMSYQLLEIDALDYCGSCGNAMLEVSDYSGNTKVIADMIGDYISNKQERLENGMFYRKEKGNMHENSIWADDLYMSVPFLCRYYLATGDTRYLDDAINQFKCFKEYLFMPEKKIMSHTYNLTYNKKNKIPWGRGNGWVVFAMSELLMVLPENYNGREFLIDFYKTLCEGYLALQDECGLWHQVIDEKDAYVESSCTSMYICAFCRGIRFGWLTDDVFAKSARKAWEALCRYCIDKYGNLYAVCIGSALSFRREYYMQELGWNMNDTHGTGIVLLAGAELLKMDRQEGDNDEK